jgi:hypothetical protein
MVGAGAARMGGVGAPGRARYLGAAGVSRAPVLHQDPSAEHLADLAVVGITAAGGGHLMDPLFAPYTTDFSGFPLAQCEPRRRVRVHWNRGASCGDEPAASAEASPVERSPASPGGRSPYPERIPAVHRQTHSLLRQEEAARVEKAQGRPVVLAGHRHTLSWLDLSRAREYDLVYDLWPFRQLLQWCRIGTE